MSSVEGKDTSLAVGALIPTAGLALIPKCPMCLAAYGTVASGIGVFVFQHRTPIMILFIALLGLFVGRLAVAAGSRGAYLSALAAVAAIPLALVGKLALQSSLVSWSAVALLLAVTISEKMRKQPAAGCCQS